MIRILYVSTSTTIGGAEKTLHSLATKIDPRQFTVAGVVSLKPKGPFAEKLEAAGIKVSTLGLQGLPSWKRLKDLGQIISQTRPDIVHAFMYQAIQFARGVKKLGYADFKLISSPRVSYRTRSALTLWIDRISKSADNLLITESDASRDYLTNRLGYDPTKVTTIHNGTDSASWPVSKAMRNDLCVKLPMRHTDFLIGTMGRLDDQKGHAYLLEAVAKLQVIHPVQCVIVGDGPLRTALEGLIRKLNLRDRVHLVGEQTDIPAWLGAMDVFVLPSLWEGFPNALLEAMGMGLAVVATNVDGVPEVVEPGATGLLCAPKDSQALFNSIQELILKPDLRKRLGTAAKERVSSKFRLPDMIKAYENAYSRIAGNTQ